MARETAAPVARVLLASVLLFQLWLLKPERSLHPAPLNDDALHIAASSKARDLLRCVIAQGILRSESGASPPEASEAYRR